MEATGKPLRLKKPPKKNTAALVKPAMKAFARPNEENFRNPRNDPEAAVKPKP